MKNFENKNENSRKRKFLKKMKNTLFQIFSKIFIFGNFHSCAWDEPLHLVSVALLGHQQFMVSQQSKVVKLFLSFLCCFPFISLRTENSDSLRDLERELLDLKHLPIILFLSSYICSEFTIHYSRKGYQEEFSRVCKDSRDLRDKLKAQGLEIANFLHEMCNFLSMIRGSISVIKVKLVGIEVLRQLEILESCSEIILQHINKTIDGVKLKEDKLELNPSGADVYKLIDRVWSLAAMKIRQKQLKGELYMAKNLPRYI